MATALKRLVTFLLIIVLTGCGVSVGVRPTPAPTSVPRSIPNVPYNVTRTLSQPRLTVSMTGRTQGNLFWETTPLDVYMLADQGARIEAQYEVTWYTTTTLQHRVRMTLYQRPPGKTAWERYDGDEITLTAQPAPALKSGTIGLYWYADTTGIHELRAEVELLTRSFSETLINLVETREFRGYVLPTYEPNPNLSGLRPAIGALNVDAPLVDWRSWSGGPCALERKLGESVPQPIRSACEQYTARQYAGAKMSLLAGIAALESGEMRAFAYDLIGLISYSENNFTTAAEAFGKAHAEWLKLRKTGEFASSVLNHSASLQALDPTTPDSIQITQLALEIHTQSPDYAGWWLLQANRGLLDQDTYLLGESAQYFEENELPQAPIIRQWEKAASEG
jgi:hypothetical protein